MPRRAATVLLLGLATGWVSAQEKPNQPAFRSGVELVQLDVSVLDDERRPVRGLTATDFTVLENGKPRPIRSFSAVEIPARTTEGQPVWSKDVAPDVATNQIAEGEGRLLVILMDRSIPRNGISVEAQKVAIAAVDQLGPRDLAALVSTSGNYKPQTFTSDRERLVKAIMQRDWSTESALYPWRLDDASDARCFCGLCVLESITRISDALRDAPQRRKILLFFGQGITISMTSQTPSESAGCEMQVRTTRQKLYDSLAVSGLTIHSIDPKALFTIGDHTQASVAGGIDRPGLPAPQARLNALKAAGIESQRNQESLAILPDRTGGRRVINTNGLTEKVAEIIHESDVYYVVGFERDPSAPMDTRRSVSIKVRGRNVQAYTQRQFIADSHQRTASSATTGSTADDALAGLLPVKQRPLGVNLAAFAGVGDGRPTVRVTLDAGSFAQSATDTSVDVKVVAFDQTGNEIASVKQTSTLVAAPGSQNRAPVVDVSTHIDLEPGDYEIRAAVTETNGGRTASVFGQVAVPQFASDRLSLSDIAVERAADTSGASAAAATTTRSFTRTDRVRASVEIYQGLTRTDPIVPVTTRMRILDASGAVARDQSMVFTPMEFRNRRTDCQIDLPLDRLAPGEYLLEIAATAGDRTLTRKLRLAVQ